MMISAVFREMSLHLSPVTLGNYAGMHCCHGMHVDVHSQSCAVELAWTHALLHALVDTILSKGVCFQTSLECRSQVS